MNMNELSLQGIESFEFTLNSVLELLENPVLIDTIKSDSLKDGTMAFNKVIDIMEHKIKNLDLSTVTTRISNHGLYNLAYLFPDQAIGNGYATSSFYLSLTFEKFNQIVSRKSHAKHILRNYLRRKEWRSQSEKILSVLFKLLQSGDINRDEEIKVLSDIYSGLLFDSKNVDNSSVVKEAISLRLTNLLKKNTEVFKPVKIALIVSGQLRGYRDAIPSITRAFTKPENVDVFVSTWDDVGHGKVSIERVPRFFDEEALNYLRREFSQNEILNICKILVERVTEREAKEDIKNFLIDEFKAFSSVQFNSFNDQLYPFKNMSNSEKMYFHNSFWFETLGSDYFNKYDLVIKIRPDLKLHEGYFFDESEYQKGTVYVETPNGWMFMDWGFGIGDQIISGSPTTVIDVLTVHGAEKLSSRMFRDLHGSSYNYSGHRNCGYEAYLGGCECEMTPVRPSSICNVRKFTLQDVLNAIDEIKET